MTDVDDDEYVLELRDIITSLEKQIHRLEDENKSLKLHYKDWLEQQNVIRGVREALWDFAKHARTEFVKEAARRGQFFHMTATKDGGHLTPAYFLNAAYWHDKTDPRTGSAK